MGKMLTLYPINKLEERQTKEHGTTEIYHYDGWLPAHGHGGSA
jgi:hypothetical protein